MKFLKKLLMPVMVSGLMLTSCGPKEAPAPKYTVASAVDSVAVLISDMVGQEITANHDEYGDYIFLYFADSVDTDTLKAITTYYFIPEDFTTDMEWTSDFFDDGTPVDYIDYVYDSKVGLEYCVFDDEGVYFQVVGFDATANA